MASGTKKVGSTIVLVLEGPLEQDTMFQNQGTLPMIIGIGEDLEIDSVQINPYGSFVVGAGVPGIWAYVPTARGTTTYRLFYSEMINERVLSSSHVADVS